MVHVFIVNPIACEKDMAQKLREELSKFQGLSYYVLTTREPGHERELVEVLCHFFDNDDVRFYCVGGAGTLKNMLDGFPDMKRAEITMIPYGHCNFLYNFTENVNLFRDLEALIHGEAVYVDYFETNVGRCVNSVSFGMDSEILANAKSMSGLSIFGRKTPMVTAMLSYIMFGSNREYDVEIDDKMHHDKVTGFFMKNGNYLGNKISLGVTSDIRDGYADYVYICNKLSFNRANTIWRLENKKNYEDPEDIEISKARKIKIRRENGSPFNISMDGEVFQTYELNARIVHQGLRFIVPKGVIAHD